MERGPYTARTAGRLPDIRHTYVLWSLLSAGLHPCVQSGAGTTGESGWIEFVEAAFGSRSTVSSQSVNQAHATLTLLLCRTEIQNEFEILHKFSVSTDFIYIKYNFNKGKKR
jgi:hypothetical protein